MTLQQKPDLLHWTSWERKIKAKNLTGINKSDSIRIITLVDEIMDHIQPGDRVCIEGFAHAAKGNYVSQMFGIG
ncbi:hypothetical protein P7H06_15345 [Paenibacillus larvae]|nr:hypothetical protein [Paenibacillus larvae]MDT2260600.1 hypothetical protein [Paenibacillus larvae]